MPGCSYRYNMQQQSGDNNLQILFFIEFWDSDDGCKYAYSQNNKHS